MIQLTKGTNVLDINLSDFSGAGQDVVQNGSFDDIGSDLILNGDFAEIGSDLVTNGDFSDVPLGSELVTDGDFSSSANWYEGAGCTISGNQGIFTAATPGSGFTGNNLNAAICVIGKSYKVTYTIDSITSGSVGLRHPFTGTYYDNTSSFPLDVTEYVVADDTDIYIQNSGTTTATISNVSVKEAINLVSNPNFTDGVEKIVDGDFPLPNVNWLPLYSATINGGSATITGLGSLTSTGSNHSVSQSVTDYAVGNSYKVTFTAKQLTGVGVMYGGIGYVNGFSQVITADYVTYTFYQTVTGSGGSWEKIAFGGILASGAEVTNTFEIKDVSVKELGEDWIDSGTPLKAATFDANGLTITSVNGGGNDNRVSQANVTEAAKSYKVTYTIHSATLTGTNVFQYYNGSAYVTLSTAITGTPQTFYFTREDVENGWYFRVAVYDGSTTDFVTISSISIQELGEGWTVQDGWSIGEDKAIADGTGSYKQIYQFGFVPTSPVGKTFKISIKIEDWVSGGVTVGVGGYDRSGTLSGNGTYEEYVTVNNVSGNKNFYVVTWGTFVGSITNITVQEVGQDWTFESGWGMGENKAIANTSGTQQLYQNIGLVNGNNYKVTYTIADFVSGAMYLYLETNGFVGNATTENTTVTQYVKYEGTNGTIYFRGSPNASCSITNISVQQLDTNNRWVTFADPDSLAVMKLGQVDLEIDASGHDCGVYQTGLIKPNKLYIITINMKATAAINVEIAASLGTAVSAVIGTTVLTTEYKEYSFEYVTPFSVDHDLQIHRLFGTGADQTISIDYVSMNGVDESKWINDPTWNPFATSLVFVPTLTDESTNNSKQFTLFTAIAGGGWNGRSLHGQVIINNFPSELPDAGIINLQQPDFLEGFYQVEIRGYLGTFYRILGKGMAHLERASTEDGYNRFEAYNDLVTYKAYEE